jgi:hypothetical protein
MGLSDTSQNTRAFMRTGPQKLGVCEIYSFHNMSTESPCSCWLLDCSRIVPEYSFLDARGLGAFEGKSLDALPEVSICTV